MPVRILVPVDGAPAAPTALRYAFRLADRLNGAVYVASLSEHDESGSAVVFANPVSEQELAVVRNQYGGFRAADGVHTLDRRTGSMPIQVFVEESSVNVMVMPTHERNAVLRAVRGTLDDHVVRQLGIPVILLHPQQPGTRIREEIDHVLVALDGTSDALRAVDALITLDPESRLRYTLVEVVAVAPQDTFGAAVAAQITDNENTHIREEASTYLSEVADRLRARGSETETIVLVQDDPGRALLHEVERLDVDLIAMTTHSTGGWRHHDVGGVAARVLHHTTVPIMLMNVTVAAPGIPEVSRPAREAADD